MATSYEQCYSEVSSSLSDDSTMGINEMLLLNRCLSDLSDNQNEILSRSLDSFFRIFAGTVMFLMQAGFAMISAGSVRRKNIQNTLMKNLLDACGAAIGFWAIGYSFSYSYLGQVSSEKGTFIGNSYFFMTGLDEQTGYDTASYDRWFFHFAFAATSATIVAGALAERCQMISYVLYSFMITGFVYPVVAHAIWSSNGFLSPGLESPLLGSGVIDFAGSGVVHITGGMIALIASLICKPRKERMFKNEDGTKLIRRIKGHSPSLQVLGTFIVWFGWYGFNAGSVTRLSSPGAEKVASLAAVNTALGGASGCLSSLLFSVFLSDRRDGEVIFDITDYLNGTLTGLVSITAGCSIIPPWCSVIVGSMAGILYVVASESITKMKIDDAVDAIPVHLCGGLWGMLSVGLFASPRLFYEIYGSDFGGLFFTGSFNLLGANFAGVLFIIGWNTIIMFPFFSILNCVGWFREDPMEELVGLDISWHGADTNLKSLTTSTSSINKDILEHLERRRNNTSVDNFE